MKRVLLALTSLAALAACQPEPAGTPVARVQVGGTSAASTAAPTSEPTIGSAVESACRSIIFENTPLTDCLAVPGRHKILTVLADAEGTNYRSLFRACAHARIPDHRLCGERGHVR